MKKKCWINYLVPNYLSLVVTITDYFSSEHVVASTSQSTVTFYCLSQSKLFWLLCIPRIRTEHGEAAFSFCALQIWNKLQGNSKKAETLSSPKQIYPFAFLCLLKQLEHYKVFSGFQPVIIILILHCSIICFACCTFLLIIQSTLNCLVPENVQCK